MRGGWGDMWVIGWAMVSGRGQKVSELVDSKKVLATFLDFDNFFYKKSPILKIKVGFFSS